MTLKEEVNKIIYDRSQQQTIITKNDFLKINSLATETYSVKHPNLKVIFKDTFDYKAMVYLDKPIMIISMASIELDVINYLSIIEENNPNKYNIINAEILAVYFHEISHLEHYDTVGSSNIDFNTNYTKLAYEPLHKIQQIENKLETKNLPKKERNKLVNKVTMLFDKYISLLDVDIAENMADYDGYDKIIKLLNGENNNKIVIQHLEKSLLKEITTRYKIAQKNHGQPSPFNVFHDNLDDEDIINIVPEIIENRKVIDDLSLQEKLRYGLPLDIPLNQVTAKKLFKSKHN